MKIYVRRRHIDGIGRLLGECPIEAAYREATGKRVFLAGGFVDLTRLLDGTRLPRSAQRFIARFDSGKPVKPFAFVLK